MNSAVKYKGLLSVLTIDSFPSVKDGLISIFSAIEDSQDRLLILNASKTDKKYSRLLCLSYIVTSLFRIPSFHQGGVLAKKNA